MRRQVDCLKSSKQQAARSKYLGPRVVAAACGEAPDKIDTVGARAVVELVTLAARAAACCERCELGLRAARSKQQSSTQAASSKQQQQ
jgi:hypothetical protein